MYSVEQIWEAQESAYNKMMEDDDQYCHPESFRWGFEQGVEWAEKDLAFTKDDVRTIYNLVRDLQVKYSATERCLQEVADIFNKQRKEKL